MARYIYKYAVRIDDTPTQLLLDEGAEVLSVMLQFSPQWHEDVIVFYAFCEDGAPTAPRRFWVHGTGHQVPEGAVHRGTVKDGAFVWHLMELVE